MKEKMYFVWRPHLKIELCLWTYAIHPLLQRVSW